VLTHSNLLKWTEKNSLQVTIHLYAGSGTNRSYTDQEYRAGEIGLQDTVIVDFWRRVSVM